MSLPMGCRFLPSDEELVSFFLKKKVTCQLHPSWNTMIVERDIYAEKSPWNVFSTKDPWVQVVSGNDTKMCIYIFTTLKFLGKKRIARTAGYGSWHGETGPHEIVDKSGAVIGKKEMFSYESRDESLKGRGHWYMHEYALTCNSVLEGSEGRPMNYVLCKITRDVKKPLKITALPKKKRKHAYDQEENSSCATASNPDQYHAKDDFLVGFSGKLEIMLTDGASGSDDVVRAMETSDELRKGIVCGFETDASKELSNTKPLFTSLSDVKAFLMSDDEDAAHQEENSYCAAASQPVQFNAKNDCLDGFSGELENMLEDGVVGFDDVACTVTTNMEDNLRNSSCSTTPLVDDFLNSFPEVEEKMLGSGDMARAMESFDEFWEEKDSEIQMLPNNWAMQISLEESFGYNSILDE